VTRFLINHWVRVMVVASFILAAGCTPVDRWSVYADKVEYEQLPVGPDLKVEPVELQIEDGLSPLSAVLADQPIKLSVEQAVMMALTNNRDLQVERHGPVITGTFELIERGDFDPELFAEVEYFRERSSESSRSTGEQFDVAAEETSGIVGLRQTLPTGTTVEASLEQERSISNRAPEQQTARAGLSVTQSLLRGFGPAANLASVRQAELDTLASRYQLRGFAEALLSETEIAYWNFVLAREEIAIYEESLAVARKQKEEVELRIEVGILPEIEVAAARAEEALRMQALIDGRSQLEDRRLRLLRMISPSPAGQLNQQLAAVSELRLHARPIVDLEDRLLLAEQSRPDLNEARLRLQQRRLETVVTRNGVLPKLDLFFSLGKTGYGTTFSDSFNKMDGKTYDLTAGIQLSHLIGDRAGDAKNLAARASRQQAREAVANLRQLVEYEVRIAANEVERTRQQIDATRATRAFQEQSLKAEKERFDVGTGTALLVAQAQRDLLESQIAEIEAVVDYRVALVQLYLAEGSLLERRGVTLSRDVTGYYR